VLIKCISYKHPLPCETSTNRLGDYEATQFDDDRVAIPLSKFRLAIEAIEAKLVEE